MVAKVLPAATASPALTRTRKTRPATGARRHTAAARAFSPSSSSVAEHAFRNNSRLDGNGAGSKGPEQNAAGRSDDQDRQQSAPGPSHLSLAS